MTSDLLVENFRKKLLRHLKSDLELVINDNRSTMLNVLSRGPKKRLSLHKMFLEAPEEVISAVAHYVGGRRRKHCPDALKGSLKIRSFIQSNLERLDYSQRLQKTTFETKGEVYDLQKIFNAHNAAYFEDKLTLFITWYGEKGQERKNRRRSRIIFGQYFDHLRLIKIHRRLDSAFFPPYFVSFVVFHEMLHHIVPGYVDAKGLFRIHGAEFKKREKEFADYRAAMTWEKEHREQLFKR